MKLNRTREEWAKISIDGRSYYHREKMAVEDIATLHAEVERLCAQLEAKDRLIADMQASSMRLSDRLMPPFMEEPHDRPPNI